MIIQDLISERSDVLKTILNSHKVSSLYAFGSSVSGQYQPSASDIDLIVEVNENDPVKKGEHLLKLWDQLEEFFNNKVDLLTEASIKNPFLKKSIEATKIKIYDGREKKVLV